MKGVESELLLMLDFDLMALTPLHFLKSLHATGFLLSSDQKISGKDISEKTLFKVKEYSFTFCDAVNEYYDIAHKY